MVQDDRSCWTVRDLALARLASDSERQFVQDPNGRCETYATFVGTAATLARALQANGIGRGDRVAIQCASGLPHLHAWLACGLIGATEVPINPLLRGEPLTHILATARPSLAVVDGDLLAAFLEAQKSVGAVKTLVVTGGAITAPSPPAVPKLIDYCDIVGAGPSPIPKATVWPSDIGSVMFTSGTTGPSKGAELPNAQLCLMARQAIDAIRLVPEDCFYCIHPLNHIAGKYMGVLAIFAVGGRLVLDLRFDATTWIASIRASGATASIAHGPMIEMIVAQPSGRQDRDHALRRLMCCPMPKHLWGDVEARFGLKAVEMWGMTEVGCPIWTEMDGPHVPGSCGRVLSQWCDLRILDPDTDEELPLGEVGEIAVRPRFPSTAMAGYLERPDETVKAWRNLWFHTGDAARIDSDGHVYFVGRLKERIRRRSENISAYDIEVAAMAYPSIREAAAVGVPSGFEGDDDIKLCLVSDPDTPLQPHDLIAFLARRLPPFMVPRYIETRVALPRTPTNKVRKRELSAEGVTPETWDRRAAQVRLRDMPV